MAEPKSLLNFANFGCERVIVEYIRDPSGKVTSIDWRSEAGGASRGRLEAPSSAD